jgi:hypothetical protein
VIGPLPAPVVIGVGVLAATVILMLVLVWGPFCNWAHGPVILRRGHLVALAVALTVPACTAMVVSLLGRVKLDNEIRHRIANEAAEIRDRQLTRQQVAGIAQAIARLQQPTTHEQLARINRALKVCAAHSRCRSAFVRTVNTIVRSPGGVGFVPAPTGNVPPPVTKTVVVQGQPGATGAPGAMGAPGRDGQAGLTGKPGGPGEVNSNIVDGLDNRVADLEHGLARVVQSLCVPALARLLHLVGVCP